MQNKMNLKKALDVTNPHWPSTKLFFIEITMHNSGTDMAFWAFVRACIAFSFSLCSLVSGWVIKGGGVGDLLGGGLGVDSELIVSSDVSEFSELGVEFPEVGVGLGLGVRLDVVVEEGSWDIE